MTDKLALEKAIDFIESLTRDPLLLPDDIEMSLNDVQEHARIELASIRKVLASPAPPQTNLRGDEAIEREHQDFRLQNDRDWMVKIDHLRAKIKSLESAHENSATEGFAVWLNRGPDVARAVGATVKIEAVTEEGNIITLMGGAVPTEHARPSDDGDEDACVVCGEHLEDGDDVYWSSNDDGHMHAECATTYVDDAGNETEEPPKPFAFRSSRVTSTEGQAE